MSNTETIRVYSDYVCPFCYLGRRSLERYRQRRADPLAVDWHPFDLRARKRGPDGEIDHAVDDGKDEDYYEQARANVRRLQERYDVEMTLGIATDIDSLPAQVASHYVKEEHRDAWEDFDEAVFDAIWQDGADIGDADLLAGLAGDVGLDGAAIRTAVADDRRRERVSELFEAARRQGITGVPTFVYGDHAARGAVPPEQLERLVEGT
ncbi:disulfide bond formation protein DsbA [Halobacteriales archaeon QS_1_68_17]|nr:MAG: disulfide bond formation protein DsbA [Halobacteriales archaeon QS_1_68_17]